MSLLGGILGIAGGLLGAKNEKKAINAQNEYNSPAQIRARAEAAGFNPLLFVGPGVGLQQTTGGSNYMGAALAESGLMIADAVAKRRNLGKLSQLQRVNQKLQDQVTSLTLRPKVGGIYAQREATPSLRSALGYAERGNGEARGEHDTVDSGGDPLAPRAGDSGIYSPAHLADRALITTDIYGDKRRPVDNAPVVTDPGYSVVDNPNYGRRFPVPTFQGEILDPSQLAVLGASKMKADVEAWFANRAFDKMAKEDAESRRKKKRPPATFRFDPNHRDGYYWSY